MNDSSTSLKGEGGVRAGCWPASFTTILSATARYGIGQAFSLPVAHSEDDVEVRPSGTTNISQLAAETSANIDNHERELWPLLCRIMLDRCGGRTPSCHGPRRWRRYGPDIAVRPLDAPRAIWYTVAKISKAGTSVHEDSAMSDEPSYAINRGLVDERAPAATASSPDTPCRTHRRPTRLSQMSSGSTIPRRRRYQRTTGKIHCHAQTIGTPEHDLD